MAKKLSKEQWEQRIREAGAGRYEFICWDGNFENGKTKAKLKCLKHFIIWPAQASSLYHGGHGCSECSSEKKGEMFRGNPDEYELRVPEGIEFISWPNGFINLKSKMRVLCKKHNMIWEPTVANLIYNGHRCMECGKESTGDRKRLPPESYIERLPHGVRFIKWHDKYKGAKSLMIVSCTNGHTWKANSNNIIHGMQGCPYCANRGFQLDETGYLYALRSECGLYVKIGISNKPKIRQAQLKRATPFMFSLIEQISGDGAKIAELEKYFHRKYERTGFTGFDGCTEWLICTPQLLEELRELEDVK